MARSLKKFREIVFQLLYSRDFKDCEKEGAVSLVMRQNAIPKSAAREALAQVEAILASHEQLDAHIARLASDYELDEIHRVERAILRLGLYELLHTQLPPKVAISEAVRLGKKYATKEGASFINALLDSLYKEKEDVEPVSKEHFAQ